LDYALFPLDFFAPVFAAAGVVFEAGATTFFFLFDVVITSFSVFFVHCGFCHVFMFFWYRDIRFVLCRNLNDLKGVFLWTAGGKRAGGLHHPGQGMQDTDSDFAALSNSEPLPAGIGRTDGIPRTFSCCNVTFRSTDTFLTYYPWEIKPDYRVDPTVSLYQIVQLPHYADRDFQDICPFHTVPAQKPGAITTTQENIFKASG
jgi:hypothetical protein